MARRTKVERMLARFSRRFGPDVSAEPEVSAEPATPAPAPAVVRFVPPAPRPPALPVPLPVAALPAPAAPAPPPEASSTPWVSPEKARRIEPGPTTVRPVLLTADGRVLRLPPEEWYLHDPMPPGRSPQPPPTRRIGRRLYP